MQFCRIFLASLLAAGPAVLGQPAPTAPNPDAIRLIVMADDMDVARGVNDGTIQAYRSGIVRTTNVVVPGPWLLDAVQQLRENPGLDVGVHLTLTSEWELVKWRPLTHAPGLVDANGFFFPMTSRNTNFAPGNSMLVGGGAQRVWSNNEKQVQIP